MAAELNRPRRVRIATRKSPLALWQAEHAAVMLSARCPDLVPDLVPMTTRGDQILDRSLAEFGGKGLFLKELEHAILEGRADLAVHSLKDVPATLPDGLCLACFLPREDHRDLWLSADGLPVGEMPDGSRVGTSSLRRQSQLLAMHHGLEIVAVRGNVQTRLEHLDDGRVDALVLAAAGLKRLGLSPPNCRVLDGPEFLPAPGQGVIAIECRADDHGLIQQLESIACPDTTMAVRAERAVVQALGGDCRMPLAALARLGGEDMALHARLASPDGQTLIDAVVEGSAGQAESLGQQAADLLIERGGQSILDGLEPARGS